MIQVDIGIFAYNEEKSIPLLLDDISSQTILSSAKYDIKFYLLANGCSDNTTYICHKHLETKHSDLKAKFEVLDIKEGGKSRTWNTFTHELSRKNAASLIYMDADIRLTEPDIINQLIKSQIESATLKIVCSKPVKDIANSQMNLNLTEKLIISAGGTSDNWKKSVCGQLYIADSQTVRNVYMPIGLPVEDGFIRAMTLTTLFSQKEDTSIIDGFDDIFHEYESIRTISELIKHQVRIVIGSSINFAIFKTLENQGQNFEANQKLLKEASEHPEWLQKVVRSTYPKLPFGYVPFHFATKRISAILKSKPSIKQIAVGIAGFGFDLIVWVIASFKMAQGKGVGYW